MNCLKCGRETNQTFCDSCREVMARYPVKSGTIVQIPKDRSASYTRHNQNRRPRIPPEVQLENQKRTIHRLAWIIALLVVLLLGTCAAFIWIVKSPTQPPVGQNYTSVTKSTEELTQPTSESETVAETK